MWVSAAGLSPAAPTVSKVNTTSATRTLRVGTWNLAGRWTPEHAALIEDAGCDVWMLTEVSERVAIEGWNLHLTERLMAPKRRWAGVLSTSPLTALLDPHPASALATVAGVTFCSSILPWRSCGEQDPWVGDRHSLKTENAVKQLLTNLRGVRPLVWGGDWNHALTGREYAGSIAGRASIQGALEELRLRAVTTEMPHQIDGLLSIDHLAIGPGLTASRAEHLVAAADGVRLSDHDAYLMDLVITSDES